MLLNCGVGEDNLETPLDCKEIQPVHSKGDQSWVFFGRNDAKAETPVLRPPHAKSWLIGKDSDAGRDWGQEENGTTEDEMAGRHHRLDGCQCEWTLGVGDGQGGLVCWDSWGRKESDATEWLNWTEVTQQTHSYTYLYFIWIDILITIEKKHMPILCSQTDSLILDTFYCIVWFPFFVGKEIVKFSVHIFHRVLFKW